MYRKLTTEEMLKNEELRNKAMQSRLEQENEQLKTKLQVASEVLDFQEELIVELAIQVY